MIPFGNRWRYMSESQRQAWLDGKDQEEQPQDRSWGARMRFLSEWAEDAEDQRHVDSLHAAE